jgi:hypothetical protein
LGINCCSPEEGKVASTRSHVHGHFILSDLTSVNLQGEEPPPAKEAGKEEHVIEVLNQTWLIYHIAVSFLFMHMT